MISPSFLGKWVCFHTSFNDKNVNLMLKIFSGGIKHLPIVQIQGNTALAKVM